MIGMKKVTELIRLFSMPVFSVIFVAVLVLDAVLYNSMYMNMEANLHEVGEARLSWIEQTLQRYINITEVMEERVTAPDGREMPNRAKLADFVKMDDALRSIQLIPVKGEFIGYNQDADIRDFRDLSEGPLKKAAAYTKKSGYVRIVLSVNVGKGLKDIVVLHPVYREEKGERRYFWGYILEVIDTRLFLQNANIDSLKEQDILCSLFKEEETGEIRNLYESGNYRNDAVKVSRSIYGDTWTLYLHPKGPWVNPWIIILTTWAGILTALTLAVLARRNARLRRIGTTDALTGVYNRNGGDWAVKEYLASHDGEPALVMAMDIDNFKIINDVYGHEAGDLALCQFTKNMKETFGTGTIITRNGGDEFIIFCGYGWSRHVAEAICRFTEKPHIITYKGKEIQFSASLGLARYPDQDRDYRGLCIKADYALYGAKLNGKARWKEFDPELTPEDTRTQLGFNLTDIGNEMPGAMAVYRAEDKHILYASSPMVELMECENLDDFMKYTAMAMDKIFPDSVREEAEEDIDRQMKDPANRRRCYFIETEILTKKGNRRPVEIRGRWNHNTNYGDVFYVFLYEKEQKEP
jgi:diguanylate cyclase (GGDEF)-like protein